MLQKPKQRNKKQAFALIVSLLVMSLILILTLATTSFLRVSIQKSSNSRELASARQNAILAAMEAIANIQKYSGNDQRVSAPAELFGEGSEPDHWTGIWDADSNSTTYKERIAWLSSEALSGLKTTGQQVSIGFNYDSSPSEIKFAKHLLDSANTNSSEIGWTVIDEGTKAKLSLRHIEDYLEGKYKTSVPGSVSINPISDTLSSNSDISKLSRLLQREQFSLIENKTLNQDVSLFNDYTLHSKGVLSNTRTGGLQKNLSAAFSYDTEFQKLLAYAGKGPDKNLIFDQYSSSNNRFDDPGGPKWQQMKSFFRMGESIIDGNPESIDMVLPDQDNSGVSPVMTQMQLFFYVGLVQKPSDPIKYDLYWFFIPSIVLWNPYDIQLNTPEIYLQAYYPEISGSSYNGKGKLLYGAQVIGTMAKNNHKFMGLNENKPTNQANARWVVKHKITSFDDLDAWPFKDTTYGAGDDIRTQEPFKFKLPAATFAPGQAKVFALRQNKELRDNPDLNELADIYASGGSFNNGFAFYRNTSGWVEWNPGDYDLWLVLGGRQNIYDLTWELNTSSSYSPSTIVQRIDRTPFWGIAQNTPSSYNLEANFYKAPLFQKIETNNPIPVWDTVVGSTGVVSDRYPTLGYSYSYIFPDNKIDDYDDQKRLAWLAQHNPRAAWAGMSPLSIGTYQDLNWWTSRGIDQHATFYGSFTTDPNWSEIEVNSAFDGAAVGTTDRTSGHKRTTLFTIPRSDTPIQSIADFTHTNFNQTADSNGWQTSNYALRFNYNNYVPAYPIGNSIVDARIPSELTEIEWKNHPENVKNLSSLVGHHYDYSYKMNDALYDHYFLNSLSYGSNNSGDISFPLPNTRLIPFGLKKKDYSDIQSFDDSANHLMIDGAFNVNSLSINAWKSILGSYNNVKSIVTNNGNESLNNESPFLRINNPQSGKDNRIDPNSNEAAFNGFRALTDSEIDLLANTIVAEIKDRKNGKHPYLSMAEFVNRNPSSSTMIHRVRGLIQNAIDKSGINAHFDTTQYLIDPTTEHLNDYPSGNMSGSVHAGVPGYLMQSDILARLGSIMTVRSDTFTVFAYGNYKDPVTGKIKAECKCEVIVQRTPELVDESRSSNDRRYEIVSFRWL